MNILIAEGNCCKEVDNMTSEINLLTPQSSIAKTSSFAGSNVRKNSTMAKSSALRHPKVKGKRGPYLCGRCRLPKKHHVCTVDMSRVALTLALAGLADGQETEFVVYQSIVPVVLECLILFFSVCALTVMAIELATATRIHLRSPRHSTNFLAWSILLGFHPDAFVVFLAIAFLQLAFVTVCTRSALHSVSNTVFKVFPALSRRRALAFRRKVDACFQRRDAKLWKIDQRRKAVGRPPLYSKWTKNYKPQAGSPVLDLAFIQWFYTLKYLFYNSRLVSGIRYYRMYYRLRNVNACRELENLLALGTSISSSKDTVGVCSCVFLYLQTIHRGSMVALGEQALRDIMDYLGLTRAPDGTVGYTTQAQLDMSALLAGKETFRAVRDSVAYDKLMDLISVVCAVGMCSFTSLNFSIGGVKLFSEAVKKKHADSDIFSVVEVIMEVGIFFFEGGHQYFTTGNVNFLRFGEKDTIALQDKIHRVEKYVDAMNIGSLSLIEPPIKEFEVGLLIDEVIGDVKKIVQSTAHPAAIAIWRRKYDDLLKLRDLYDERKANGGLRCAAFALVLFGGTCVGKSGLMNYFHHLICKANGFDDDLNKVFKVPLWDEYDTNLRNDTVTMMHDDVANTKAKFVRKPPSSQMIEACNQVKMTGVMADLEQKGRITPNPKIFIASTNVKELDASTYSNEPLSVLRRAVHVDVEVKPEFTTNGRLDTAKVMAKLGHLPHDAREIWDFQLRVPVPLEGVVGNQIGWRYFDYRMVGKGDQRRKEFYLRSLEDGPNMNEVMGHGLYAVHTVNRFSLSDLSHLVVFLSKKHYSEQIALVESINSLGKNMTLLECGCVTRCSCRGTPMVFDIQAGDAHPVEDSSPPIDTVEVLDSFAALQQSFLFCFSSLMTHTGLLLEHPRLTPYLHLCEAHYGTCVSFVKGCVFSVLFGFLWACFLPLPLILIILLVLSVPCVTGLVYILCVWTYARYQGRLDLLMRANDLVTATWRMERKQALKWILGLTVVAGSAYAILKQRRHTIQGGVTSQEIESIDRKASVVEQVKHEMWEKIPLATDATEKALTRSSKQTMSLVERNLVALKVKTPKGSEFTMDAFEMKTGVLMLNWHIFQKYAGARLQARAFKKGDVPGTSYPVSLEGAVQLGNTDLCLVLAPQMGDVKDMSDHLPPHFMQSECGVVIRKHLDGSIEASRVRLRANPAIEVDGVVPYEGYEYVASRNTKPGDCMAAVLSLDLQAVTHIVGFHSAGGNGTTNGVACAATRPLYDAALAELSQNPLYLDLAQAGTHTMTSMGIHYGKDAPMHPKSVVRSLPEDAIFEWKGSVEGGGTYHSAIHKTIISDTVEEVCGVPCGHGPPRFKVKPGEPTMWQTALEHMTNPANELPMADVDYAIRDYTATVHEAIASSAPELIQGLRPLSEVEIVSGRDGERFVDSINSGTSMGYPIGGPKRSHLVDLPPTEEHANPRKFEEEIMEFYYLIESIWATGTRTYEPFKAVPKDEATKLGKDKVRIFEVVNIALQIGLRKYFLPIARSLSLISKESECTVGLNPYSEEWHKLDAHLCKFGEDRILAGDYAKFDLRMNVQLNIASFSIFIGIAEKFGNYSPRDLDVMRTIATEVCYPVLVYNGDLLKLKSSTPSGHNMTVYSNSVNNSLLMRCAYRSIRDLPPGSEERFQDYVALGTYGDDNKGSVSKEIEGYNHVTVANYLGEHGYVYTMPDKTSDPVPFMHTDDCDFLKRKSVWCPELELKMGALDEDSIFKSLHCVGKSELTPDAQAAYNIEGALREWFNHGRDVYEQRRMEMTKVAQRHNLDSWIHLIHENYDARLAAWRERYQPNQS